MTSSSSSAFLRRHPVQQVHAMAVSFWMWIGDCGSCCFEPCFIYTIVVLPHRLSAFYFLQFYWTKSIFT